MSQSATIGDGPYRAATRPREAAAGRQASLSPRRRLQLALGCVWLLDAILQFQPVMFATSFGRSLAASAAGNPDWLARPIIWSAGLVGQHAVAANTAFACIQLLLGLGIAWRPTAKLALGASVVWSLAVWWLGEGFGGVLGGGASPVNGAPGPVILYALLAVLLWPSARDRPAPLTAAQPAGAGTAGDRRTPFPAAQAVGARTALALWLVLWGSLAYFALQPAARAPQAMSGMFADMAAGEPHWLAWLDNQGAALLAHQGLLASVLLAAALIVVAIGLYLPPRYVRPVLVLAMTVAVLLFIGQGLGGILTGSGTDPGSGPLLILLALAYWPRPAPPAPQSGGTP
jgi:hypothetical protein